MKVVQTYLCAGNTLQRRFHRRRGAVKHMQVCLIANKVGEIIFLHCTGLVKLLVTCLCAGNTLQRRFNCRGGAVKHVQACGSANKDGETVLTIEEVLYSWCKPVYIGKHPPTPFSPPRKCCEARAGLFKCTGLPLWRKLYFLHLLWHLNGPARSSQHHLGG